MITESALQAQSLLRDSSQFSWHIIPMFLVVLYVYFMEIDKGNWNRVLAAFAFFGMDVFNEIVNGIVFHVSDFAPLWGAPGNDTAYLLLIGLNVEICMMFAITGIAATLALPQDKNKKILGINNRIFFACCFAAFSVFVEIQLNSVGALTWEWSFWNAQFPFLVFLVGYLTFYLMCYWVYDMPSRKKQLFTLFSIYSVNLAGIALFGLGLGWL
jgi:hypothetical protein